jgi:hypothetical protein
MKKLYISAILSLFMISIYAQNFDWSKREGLWAYDYGYGVVTDPAGNIYVAGKYEMNANFSGTILPDQGNHDIYIAKYSAAGTLDWIKTAGGTLGDYAQALYCDGTSLYISGEIEGYGNVITFENSSVTLTSIGDNDLFLAKYDLAGNLLWAKSEGGNYSDKALGITADATGNVYICGYFKDAINFGGTAPLTGAGDRDIYLAKYDSNGNFLWVRSAGSAGRDEAKSVICDPAGNIYITGMHSGTVTFGSTNLTAPNGYVNMFLVKYAPDGSVIWAKTAGGDYDDVGWSMTMDASGLIYITGEYNAYAVWDAQTLTTSGSAEVFVVCYDNAGTAQWARSAGGPLIDRARGIGTDGTNIYITGQFAMSASFGAHTVSGVDSSEIFMAKLSNMGNWQWAMAVGGPPDSLELLSYESGNAICADAQGNVYATGALLAGGTFGSQSFNPYSRTDAFVTRITQGADVTAPMAVIYNPVDNSVDVDNTSNLVLTFNETVQKGTGNIIIKEGGAVTQTIDVTGTGVTVANNVVTIDATDFTAGTAVNVEIAAGALTDMAGNSYAGISDAASWNFTVSSTTGIAGKKSHEFSIYPNPNTGTFTIQLTEPAADITVSVTNCLGQSVYKATNKQTSRLAVDLTGNDKGIYFVEVKTTDSSVVRKKIIVQ